MKYRAMFVAGAAVGYVFGTRAGRERYDQIRRASRKVAENPTVQEAAGILRAKGGELAGVARVKGGELAGAAAGKAGEAMHKLPGRRETESEDVREPVG
ncbi:YtxH domain-containing protein [Spirillospora sp. NPDC047279]|uniref:YtxH domain-containing protein n=1 Tax=Spirillospora sp. NPDC047279 TaxID=3155478 RepID=UPI003402AEFE